MGMTVKPEVILLRVLWKKAIEFVWLKYVFSRHLSQQIKRPHPPISADFASKTWRVVYSQSRLTIDIGECPLNV